MNYRHIYHAGNFADVFKHIIVCRIVEYLKQKAQAFRVIDTHAGIGRYDLRSSEAEKTGEWHEGVQRLLLSPHCARQEMLLKPWLSALQSVNPQSIAHGALTFYPGSPLLIRHLLRKQDRLEAIELNSEDYRTLAAEFAGDYQTRILHLNGWLALRAHLPPKERRGFVLVDPPFEQAGDYDRMVQGLVAAYRRFAGGCYAFWYPLKYKHEVERLVANLRQTNIPRILRLELQLDRFASVPKLVGCGMVVVNPPYVLAEEMAVLAPALKQALAKNDRVRVVNEWICGEENCS